MGCCNATASAAELRERAIVDTVVSQNCTSGEGHEVGDLGASDATTETPADSLGSNSESISRGAPNSQVPMSAKEDAPRQSMNGLDPPLLACEAVGLRDKGSLSGRTLAEQRLLDGCRSSEALLAARSTSFREAAPPLGKLDLRVPEDLLCQFSVPGNGWNGASNRRSGSGFWKTLSNETLPDSVLSQDFPDMEFLSVVEDERIVLEDLDVALQLNSDHRRRNSMQFRKDV